MDALIPQTVSTLPEDQKVVEQYLSELDEIQMKARRLGLEYKELAQKQTEDRAGDQLLQKLNQLS